MVLAGVAWINIRTGKKEAIDTEVSETTLLLRLLSLGNIRDDS